uniref:Putative zinc finger, CCHC-type n=1 Tax=Tanacetum cinerariifolium TaxID=118510 RepID=A0A6L2J5C1_TANCI|nr:putative zinc finger, CCHC-type [Tanacetum cinerariifolium]
MARLGTILMERFPKLYALESNKDCSIRDPDVCMWTTGGDARGNDVLSLIQKCYQIVIDEDAFLVDDVEGYVLTTPIPELMEDATVEAIRIRAKWENNDYICRGHILHGMSNSLFDVYTNVESTKELWDSFESKYMAEDSSSKKFRVNNFNNYKMADSRPVMEQYNILGQYTQHGLKMNESISVSSIIDKLPPS